MLVYILAHMFPYLCEPTASDSYLVTRDSPEPNKEKFK